MYQYINMNSDGLRKTSVSPLWKSTSVCFHVSIWPTSSHYKKQNIFSAKKLLPLSWLASRHWQNGDNSFWYMMIKIMLSQQTRKRLCAKKITVYFSMPQLPQDGLIIELKVLAFPVHYGLSWPVTQFHRSDCWIWCTLRQSSPVQELLQFTCSFGFKAETFTHISSSVAFCQEVFSAVWWTNILNEVNVWRKCDIQIKLGSSLSSVVL